MFTQEPMLGIDVSKNTLACTLVDPQTHHPRWRESVPNTLAGYQALLKKVPKEAAWVLEPTGRYSLPVVQAAQADGRTVLLAPPRKAKAYLQSEQSRAKTDKIDSLGLACFALTRPQCKPLRPYPMKSALVDQLDQLLGARKGLARALCNLTLRQEALPQAHDFLEPALRSLREQIKALDKQIGTLTKSSPEFAVASELVQVHGIGQTTAAAVTARLVAKQFTHPDQFVAYSGLDIGVRQSGQRTGREGLTRQGDAEMRRLLYLCAQASLRAKDSPFKAQYERELAKGLPTTAALCAVARKMARLCWSLWKHGSSYDPTRVYQQPKKNDAQPEKMEPTP